MFSILRRIGHLAVHLGDLDRRVKKLEKSTLPDDVEDLQIELEAIEATIESSSLGNDVEELRIDVDHLLEHADDC